MAKAASTPLHKNLKLWVMVPNAGDVIRTYSCNWQAGRIGYRPHPLEPLRRHVPANKDPQPGFGLPGTMQRANLGSTDENTELTSCKLSSPYPPLDAARALSLQPRPKGRSHQMSPKMLTIGPHTPPHPASHVISGGTSFNSEHLRRCAT